MRKILGLVCLLALYQGVLAGYAAAQGKNVRTVPRTTSGSPIPPGTIKLLGPNNHSLGFKAQNLLTSEMNERLLQERAGIKNGTIDTVPYFDSWFITGTRNSIYPYSMVGHNPAQGGTTGINSEVIPLISVLTLGGAPVYTFDPTAVNDPQGSDISLIAASPLYDATTTYPGNGRRLRPDTGQVIDTAQRAEFTGVRRASWHTVLNPPASSPYIWLQYLEYNNGDWTCVFGSGPPCNTAIGDFPVVNINTISNNFAFILNFAPPPNNTVPIIVTDFVTAFIPNGGGCCVLGYHTAQNGIVDPAGVLVWTWATFIPQTTSGGFTNPFAPFGNDVMVLSHELSELFNDPFVNTNVSPWVDGSVAFAQGNLETGDVIEAMNAPDVIYNVPLMPGGKPYTYTLQNVALLEWFTRNPLGPVTGPGPGVYSWPNTNVLNNGHNPGAGCGGLPGCWVYGEGSAGFFFGPPY